MSQHSALLELKSEYLEINEYNFTWPGENGTFHDLGSINYTMPGECFLLVIIFPKTMTFSSAGLLNKIVMPDWVYLFQDHGIGLGVHYGRFHSILYSR